MAHKFDIEKAGILDSPERMEFLDPDRILGFIGLDRDMLFADLGSGTGYFSIPAASRVKKVFAIDIQKEMLDILDDKLKARNINNIKTVPSGESSIPLPDKTIDVLFAANVFHEFDNRKAILSEINRVLKSTGKLVVVDWNKTEMEMGPPLEERLTPDEVTSICNENGFNIADRTDAGPFNYLLVFNVKE